MTEVAFAFWQVGPCVLCCGNFGSKVCQHCRKKSSGCEQNSPAPLQTGKEEMGLGTLSVIAPFTRFWVESTTVLRAAFPPRDPVFLFYPWFWSEALSHRMVKTIS